MPISHTAIIFAIVFTSVQNASTNSGARAVHQRCSAPKVRAGETAVMTFFIRQDINASSDINFVTMTRASAPDHDILICDRKSPLVCKPTSNLYQTDSSIDRNRITLRIPKVTRAFEDRYVLKIYVNGQAEPTDFCYLHVQEEWTCPSGTWMCRHGTCISVHWRCDTRNDCGDNSDEQHCGEWVCPVGQWKCRDNVCISSIQRCNNRNDCSDGSDEENCDVNGANTDADSYKAEPGVNWKTATISLVGLLASFIVVAVIVAAVYVHNKRTTRNKADNADGAEGDPMLGAHIDAHTQSPRSKPVLQQCTEGQTMDTNDSTDASSMDSPDDQEQGEHVTETNQLLPDNSTSSGNQTRVSHVQHGHRTDRAERPIPTRANPWKEKGAGKPTNTEQLSSSQGKSPEKTRSKPVLQQCTEGQTMDTNEAGQPTNTEQLSRSQENSPKKTRDRTDNKEDPSRTTGETSFKKAGDRTDNKEDPSRTTGETSFKKAGDNIEDPSRTTGETSFKKAGAGTDINVEESTTTEGKSPPMLGAENYDNAEQSIGKAGQSPKTLGAENDIYAEQSNTTGGKSQQNFGDGIKTKTDTAHTAQSKLRKLRWDQDKTETVCLE